VDDGEKEISKALDGAESTLKKATAQHSHFSPPKQIQSLRNSIEEVLKELDVTLVVLIDDLDRCLPETTISTLEAIRLFLFLQGTAFVIAADDAMIKLAVKRHFQGVDDELATNYFDKLIQVPIRVPQLGVQEVRAYMMMLFLEDSYLAPERVEQIRQKVCEQLGKSWQGKRVDLQFIRSLITDLSDELIARLDAADRLAPIMATATGIAGNPRLIKRFLNALSIRMTMSNAQGVGVDETALAKMLLFERCGDPKIFDKIIKSVAESEDGKPLFLEGFETTTEPSENADPKSSQNDPFFERWCKLPPKLSGIDLRGVLYVSREHSPLISLEDRLSPESSDILNALIDHPDMASDLTDQIRLVPPLERAIIMNKLLGKAHQEQEWGAPSILEACIIISEIDSTQGQRLAGFLKERPAVQIKPSIIPKIADRNWANTVLIGWEKDPDISRMVKSAIKQRRDRGNVKI
jgi:predicted KAP-like P-loop ATPase